MSCNCGEIAKKGKLEVEKSLTIPFVAHESEMSRLEKITKRQWIALIVAIIMIFISNAIWIYAWEQYDYESYEIAADGDSNANYIGKDGNIYNGGFDKNTQTQEKK